MSARVYAEIINGGNVVNLVRLIELNSYASNITIIGRFMSIKV